MQTIKWGNTKVVLKKSCHHSKKEVLYKIKEKKMSICFILSSLEGCQFDSQICLLPKQLGLNKYFCTKGLNGRESNI